MGGNAIRLLNVAPDVLKMLLKLAATLAWMLLN